MNENSKKMPGIIQDTAGVRIAKFAVTNVTVHLCDSMKAPAGRILGNAKRSGNAKIDETSDSMAGEKIWAWVFQAENSAAVTCNKGRGSLVFDRHGQVPRSGHI
ncbi:MAG: hypothetical protein OXI27_06180 [Thaumarchaeota archaeon]|nr:hypothetical protein [Nitrososphaerota archaeon]